MMNCAQKLNIHDSKDEFLKNQILEVIHSIYGLKKLNY